MFVGQQSDPPDDMLTETASSMRLDWTYDVLTEYWALKCPIPIPSDGQEQYDGSNASPHASTWKKHLLKHDFPKYCYDKHKKDRLLCSPHTILQCLEDRNVLEALVLVINWGSMTRTKDQHIYTEPLEDIERCLQESLDLISKKVRVRDAWDVLTTKLKWSNVMTSKYLHFVARSLGFEQNPPVPIDHAVMIEQVWPTFRDMIEQARSAGDDRPLPRSWSQDRSWEAYNRYMTAINCWAKFNEWTTTQVENTLFVAYDPIERLWQQSFERSADVFARMAEEARIEYREGRTFPLVPELL